MCTAFGGGQTGDGSDSEDLGAAAHAAAGVAHLGDARPLPSDRMDGRLALEREWGERCPICLD
eukprot:5083767-Alexandrium_andersonii.AAC.1